MSNQQSVLINYNPNFANGDASDFTQPFNKQLEIPANSEVAFYQGQLQRKTIVIPETETVTINYVEQLPTDEFRRNAAEDGIFTKIDSDKLPPKLANDTLTIKKGSYTQSEFVEEFRVGIQKNIQTRRDDAGGSTEEDVFDFMYEAVGENDQQGVFLGMNIFNQVVPITDTANVGSEVAISRASYDVYNDMIVRAQQNADNWNSFVTTQTPINPLSAIQNIYAPKQDNQQNVFFFQPSFHPEPSTSQRFYVGYLNDSFTSNMWTTPITPITAKSYPDYFDKADGVPNSFFGIEYVCDTDSSNVSTITGRVFAADWFINRTQERPRTYFKNSYEKILIGSETWNDHFWVYDMYKIFEWKIDGSYMPKQGIRIYSLTEKSATPDILNEETNEIRNYYFQILSKEYSNNSFYGYKGVDNLVFDSKDFMFKIPERLVEDAAACQSMQSNRDPLKDQYLGIKPYIFFRNCNINTYIYRPSGTFLAQRTNAGDYYIKNQPILRYNYEFKEGSTIRNILGTGRSYQDVTKISTSESRFDPNIYPQSRGRQAGINALYSDNQRYNFEIESLPIRTFNSTKNANNVSGNERTILHSTESFIDGEVTELTNSFLNKNVVPSNIKYISLNNKQKIILNDISVKVTRANTNITASEITDCSFEMLLRSSEQAR